MRRLILGIAVVAVLTPLAACAGASTASSEESAEALSFDVPPDRGVVYLYRTGRAVGAANAIEVTHAERGGVGLEKTFRELFGVAGLEGEQARERIERVIRLQHGGAEPLREVLQQAR